MNLNLNDADRSRLGYANLNNFFSHLNFLVDNPEAIESIPNNSTVIYQETTDQWVDAQNDELGKQSQDRGENVHWVPLPLPPEMSLTFPDGRKVAFNIRHLWTTKEISQITKLTVEQIKRLEKKKIIISFSGNGNENNNDKDGKEKLFTFSQVIQLQAYKLILKSNPESRGFGQATKLREEDLHKLLNFYSEQYIKVKKLEYFPVLFAGKIFPVASNMSGSQEFMSYMHSLDWKSKTMRTAKIYPPLLEVIKQLCENAWELTESQVWTQKQLEERLMVAA